MIARSGTGKSLAFVLIALAALADGSVRAALLLAPTRELAAQIASLARALAPPTAHTALLCGGSALSAQLRALAQAPPALAVGTPGRVRALLARGALPADALGLLVLDEADRLAAAPFADDVAAIARALPSARQTLAFSATFAAATVGALTPLMRSPHFIAVGDKYDAFSLF